MTDRSTVYRRREIDGLRGVAILPVVLFHTGIDWYQGGYIGVDIFFVISGYLITSLILREIEDGTFSLTNFYERRARRLLPALSMVVAICVFVSWFWMTPYELDRFGQSVTWLSLISSNFFFAFGTGYFDNNLVDPLLHTWSLSIEEQYYLVFPILLIVLLRMRRWFLTLSIVMLMTASYGSLFIPITDSSVDRFLLSHLRAWELLAGVILSLYQTYGPELSISEIRAQFLAVFGMGLVFYSLISFDRHTFFTGHQPLIPILGTSLVIFFATPETWIGKALCNRYLVGLGLTSYSAYLVHYPLFSFIRLRSLEEPSSLVWGLACIISFLVAAVSWKYVEQPFRERSRFSRRTVSLVFLGSSLTFLAAGVVLHIEKGFAGRFSPQDLMMMEMDRKAEDEYRGRAFSKSENKRFEPAGSARRMLLIGDSFARDFLNAGSESRMLSDIDLATWTIGYSCGVFFGDRSALDNSVKSKCPDAPQTPPDRLRRLIYHADIIVLAANWRPWEVEGLENTIQHLSLRQSQQLVVVGTKDFGSVKPFHYLTFDKAARVRIKNNVNRDRVALNRQIVRIVGADRFVDVQEIVCKSHIQCRIFTPAGDLISNDGSHLTKAGAQYIGEQIFSVEPLVSIVRRKQQLLHLKQ